MENDNTFNNIRIFICVDFSTFDLFIYYIQQYLATVYYWITSSRINCSLVLLSKKEKIFLIRIWWIVKSSATLERLFYNIKKRQKAVFLCSRKYRKANKWNLYILQDFRSYQKALLLWKQKGTQIHLSANFQLVWKFNAVLHFHLVISFLLFSFQCQKLLKQVKLMLR